MALKLDPAMLKETYVRWNADKAPRLAAALAYTTIFAIAPLLVIVIAIAGGIIASTYGHGHGHAGVRDQLLGTIQASAGQGAADAVRQMVAASFDKPRQSLVAQVFGWIMLVVGAAGLFAALQDALNTVWHVEPPKKAVWIAVRDRLVSIGMLLAIGFVLLATTAINAAITFVSTYVEHALPFPGAGLVFTLVNWLVSLAIVTVVFALQVGLGGLTVALANSPWSVVVHWGTAMLLLGGLTALAFLAFVQPRELRRWPSSLDALLGACAGLAFVTMLAGSYVSSSGAGLACTTLPACDGGSWTGTLPGQLAQMAHRFIAGAFFVVATLAAYGARRATPRVRAAALAGYALVIVQVVLGLGAVGWSLPVGLREAHAANACATFLAFVAALTFAAIDGTVPLAQATFDRVRIPAEARIPVEGSAG